jgi:PadR family transcriptional regulator, regulatory protein AphA
MQETSLTHTSFVMLGLVEMSGEATPYDLKQAASYSVGNFWTMQHAAFYSEPQRLAEAGLLSVKQEEGGRRRKHYRLTASGTKALDAWRAQPTADLAEIRNPALLKLFFGADPATLAQAQLEASKEKLAQYESMYAQSEGRVTPGPRASLEAGIAQMRAWVRFWQRLAG